MNTAFQAIINIFNIHTSELTLAQFILTLLEDSSLKTHPCTLALTKVTDNIITALSQHPDSTGSIFTWANNIVKKKYLESIKELTRNKDWHFNSSHASAGDLDDFRIEDMVRPMTKPPSGLDSVSMFVTTAWCLPSTIACKFINVCFYNLPGISTDLESCCCCRLCGYRYSISPHFSKSINILFAQKSQRVTTIWMPSGMNRSGIQNIRVFPEPVAETETMSLSFFRIAWTTQICHKQGCWPKRDSTWSRTWLRSSVSEMWDWRIVWCSRSPKFNLLKNETRLDATWQTEYFYCWMM